MAKELYPLKFVPILKEKVWGGNKLVQQFNKKGGENIGESWEISSVSGNISKVINGALRGVALTTLIEQYGSKLLGDKVFKKFDGKFPLLFKFIDAQQDLSVQLHPNDRIAKERHNSFGKTEMWYILSTEKEARLVLGFNKPIDRSLYKKHLEENDLLEILHSEKVNPGDAFFIAPGMVHAIGAGVMLAEIQQTSDITYRIYDWDRPGINGEMRALHNDLAIDVINYNYSSVDAKLTFDTVSNKSNLICSSPYFETNSLYLSKPIKKSVSHLDSFIVYMCVSGKVTIKMLESAETIVKGETLLIPACATHLELDAVNATLLEIYVP